MERLTSPSAPCHSLAISSCCALTAIRLPASVRALDMSQFNCRLSQNPGTLTTVAMSGLL